MKKILFHGNCQSCVVARWFQKNYSRKYQIIDCREIGLDSFWGNSSAFCFWSKQNIKKLLCKKTRHALQEKVKEADIFVFMHHADTFDEINTMNLHDNVAQGLKICLPNSRFGAYPICKWSLKPYVDHVTQNITNEPIKIAEYIKNEDDPVFTELLYEQYPFEGYTEKSISQNPQKYKKCVELYDNVIPIDDFVEKNWKDHLLFHTLNHPTEMYYKELISRLLTLLGEDFDLIEKTSGVPHPEGDNRATTDINEFLFFKKHVPNLLIPKDIKLKSFNGELQ